MQDGAEGSGVDETAARPRWFDLGGRRGGDRPVSPELGTPHPRGGGTCSSTERINALTGPVHESLTPWKHQSTSPPLEKMVKKSSMAAAGQMRCGEKKTPGPAPFGETLRPRSPPLPAAPGAGHVTPAAPETHTAALPLGAAGVPCPLPSPSLLRGRAVSTSSRAGQWRVEGTFLGGAPGGFAANRAERRGCSAR